MPLSPPASRLGAVSLQRIESISVGNQDQGTATRSGILMKNAGEDAGVPRKNDRLRTQGVALGWGDAALQAAKPTDAMPVAA